MTLVEQRLGHRVISHAIPSALTCQAEPRTILDEAVDRFMIKERFEIRQQRGGLTQKFQGTWVPKQNDALNPTEK